MDTQEIKDGNVAACEGAANGAPAAADTLPPITNRGVTMTIDYLSITAFTNLENLALKALTKLLGYELDEDDHWSNHFYSRGFGARNYSALFTGPEGMTLYGYPRDGHHTHLELKGKTLQAIPYENLVELIQCLEASELRWHATRVDIAFDHVPFTPAMCYEAYELGSFRTKANRNSGDWRSNKDGDTFYLGSRNSGRYLRVYDRRGPTRCEIQFKEDYAIEIARSIPDEQCLRRLALGYLRDFVEFTVLPVEGKNSSRVPTSKWWGSLTGCAEKISLSRETKPELFQYQKTMRYFERMLPTLCIFVYGLGVDLNECVAKYYPKLESKHKAKIDKLQKSLSGDP